MFVSRGERVHVYAWMGDTQCLPQSLCLFVHFETRSLPHSGGHQYTRPIITPKFHATVAK